MALGVNQPMKFPMVQMHIGKVPKIPKALHVSFLAADFVNDVLTLDLSLYDFSRDLDFIQSIYIDNAANAVRCRVHFDASEQHVNILGQRQGYFPVICPKPGKCHVHIVGGGIGDIYFLNVLVGPTDWAAAP